MRVLPQIPAVMLIAAVSTAAGASQWGRLIGVPELDPVIEAASASFPVRAVRMAEIEAAAAGEDLARAGRRPELSAVLDLRAGEEESPMTGGVADDVHPLRLAADLQWDLDPFRTIASAVGAASFRREAAEYAERDWLLNYRAALTGRFVDVLALEAEHRLQAAIRDSVRQSLKTLDARVAQGLAPASERHGLVATLSGADVAMSRVREALAKAQSEWTYLLGTNAPMPQSLGYAFADLRAVAPPPASSLPIRALKRPDVSAAYAMWQARDAEAASVSRARRPELSALARAEWSGPSSSEDPDEWMAWAGLRVGLPALAPDRAARAGHSAALGDRAEAVYRDTVRGALRATRDAQLARVHADERLQHRRDAARAQAARLASEQRRRAAGLIALPDLERARQQQLSAELHALDARRVQLLATTSLMRHLGGVQ